MNIRFMSKRTPGSLGHMSRPASTLIAILIHFALGLTPKVKKSLFTAPPNKSKILFAALPRNSSKKSTLLTHKDEREIAEVGALEADLRFDGGECHSFI